MEKFLNFDVENVELLEEENDSEFLTASIDAFATGISRNNTFCDEESLKESAYTIYEKPIVFTIDSKHDDFYTHVPSDQVLNAGFIIPDSATFRQEEDRTVLNVKAKIWARYSEKFVDIFKRDGNKKKVSVEAKLIDFAEDEQSGLLTMKRWIFSAVCVLGNLVESGIANANMVLNFSKENEEYQRALAMEFGRYSEIDMSIPEKVKKNAEKGLSLSKEFGVGGTSVALANARFLAKQTSVTSDKVKHISKTHKSLKNKSFIKSPPNQEYVKFMLYGGKEAISWTDELLTMIDEADSKLMSYFEEEITFPYKTLKDVNPAVRGIDPPVSLSQANHIAEVADSIGSDKEKNGWAIAINQFKKTHEVKNGKWVEKKANMSQENFIKDELQNEPEKEEFIVEDKKEEVFEETLEKETSEVEMEKKESEAEGEKPEAKEEEKFEEKTAPEDEGKEPESKEEEKKEQKAEGEDKEETPEEEKKEEDKEVKMSTDMNLDMGAMLAMLDNQTEEYAKIVEKHNAGETDFSALCKMAYEKLCKMAEDAKKAEEDKDAFMSENESLKKFKEEVEKSRFDYAVESTINEVLETMSKDKIAELREDSKNFTLETIDGWKNKVKAIAFETSKDKKPSDGITRIDMSGWANGKEADKDYSKGWI